MRQKIKAADYFGNQRLDSVPMKSHAPLCLYTLNSFCLSLLSVLLKLHY
jgi:hypothetical protein